MTTPTDELPAAGVDNLPALFELLPEMPPGTVAALNRGLKKIQIEGPHGSAFVYLGVGSGAGPVWAYYMTTKGSGELFDRGILEPGDFDKICRWAAEQ